MFRRREPLPLHHRAWYVFWPKAGWRLAYLYIAHRVRRLPGTPYRIAAGFACGAAVSFTPFIGFHFVFAALLAVVLRGNVVASAIGTAVGNPWTFPFIWTWTYTLGQWLMGVEVTSELPVVLGLNYIFERPLDVLWPMTVGGLSTGLVIWFAVFWPARQAVSEYQHARRRRIRRKEERAERARRGERARSAGAKAVGTANQEQEES